jgi:hypothetical protein
MNKYKENKPNANINFFLGFADIALFHQQPLC